MDELSLVYERYAVIDNRFCVDAYVRDLGLVVQFDGDYWHGHPDRFAELDARQKKRVQLDRSQDAYMHKHGLHVERFWETDLGKNSAHVRERLRSVVAQILATRASRLVDRHEPPKLHTPPPPGSATP